MRTKKRLKILSMHWGFIPGGGSAYARCFEEAYRYGPLKIKSICINSPGWQVDSANMKSMDVELIEINGRLDPSWIWKVRNFLEYRTFDLIMTHGFNGAFAAAISSFGLNIPIVSSWHGDYFPSTLIQRFRKPIFDVVLKVFFRHIIKEIVTVSIFSKDALLRKGIRDKKLSVIYNGIPPIPVNSDRRSEIRQSLQISEETLLVGTACRFAAQKGLQWLLRAMALALQERRDLRFVIWGEGPLKQSLNSLATELGISEFVFFPGYRPDIDKCLPALDIFVMSSFAEYFSIGLLEAMRAGLPIVATNVGGNPEAIRNGIDGILVPTSNPEALSKEILALAGDEALRNRLGQNARQRFLQEFTADKMVRETACWLVSCAQKYAVLR